MKWQRLSLKSYFESVKLKMKSEKLYWRLGSSEF